MANGKEGDAVFWLLVVAGLLAACIVVSYRWSKPRSRVEVSDDAEDQSAKEELGPLGSRFIACLGIAIIVIAILLYWR